MFQKFLLRNNLQKKKKICEIIICIFDVGLLSLAVCKFANKGDDVFVLVGTAKDLTLSPRTCSGGFIHTYQLTNEGTKLEFLHKVSFFFCTRLFVLISKRSGLYGSQSDFFLVFSLDVSFVCAWEQEYVGVRCVCLCYQTRTHT